MATSNIIFIIAYPSNDGLVIGAFLSVAPSFQVALRRIQESFIKKHSTGCDCADPFDIITKDACIIFPRIIVEYNVGTGEMISKVNIADYQEMARELAKFPEAKSTTKQ